MEFLRTPEGRFSNLPGYPFDPHYIEVPDTIGGRLRIHYVDEGPAKASPVVLFHGEPTWSFLYQAGALVFPLLALRGPEDAEILKYFTEAWEVFDRWEKPFLTAYGKADPILGWFDQIFQEYVPGAKGQPHTAFLDGIHFIQEQYGPELARIMNEFIAAT